MLTMKGIIIGICYILLALIMLGTVISHGFDLKKRHKEKL